MEILNPFDVELENTILIEASAGTGKTYTITTIYARLVMEGYRPDSILVVTFTEAAAAELKLRIRKRLVHAFVYLDGLNRDPYAEPDLKIDDEFNVYLSSGTKKEIQSRKFYLRNALKLFDETSILTIHSFCLKMLKENAFESKALFDIELSADSSIFETEICFDFFAEYISDLDPLFLRYLRKKNFTPDNLMRKFSNLLSRPDISLIPERVEFINVFDEYRNVLKNIQEYVENKAHEIKDFIQNDSDINKQSYRKNSVHNWLEQIKEQLSETGQDTVFKMNEKGDSLYKFSLTRLNEKSKSGGYSSEYEFFNLCENILEFNQVFENNIMSLELEYFEYLKDKLLKNKEASGVVFFNDLINDLAHALSDKSGNKSLSEKLVSAIQEKYHAVLIDEFQDTDQTQYSIFSRLFANRKNLFCMIGDPKQAIYGFRGGDIFAYLKAVEDSTKVYTLDKNYRSDPMLVESVNSVFINQENPFLYEKIEFHPVTTPETSKNRLFIDSSEAPCFQFLYLKNEGAKADDFEVDGLEAELDKKGFIKKGWANDNIPSIVASELAELLVSNTLLEGKQIQPSDIAVLVRKNDQANRISRALKRHKIPSHIYNNDSVFESTEAQSMIDLLCAVLEPNNESFIRAALLTDVFEFNGNDIDDLNGIEGALSVWREKFKHYNSLWIKYGFIRMIQEVFYSEEAFSKDDTYISERALTNYNHLIELIHCAETDQHLSPVFLLKWFQNEQSRATISAASEELRLETDEPAVSIVTIHKSKGLEWPVVYLPYLWDGKNNSDKKPSCLFHDPDEGFKEKYDIGSENIERSIGFEGYETRAEEVRLLYVALTRASSMLKIIWGRFNSVETSALGHILHGKSIEDDNTMLGDIKSLKENSASGIDIDIYQPVRETIQYKQDDSQKKDAGSGRKNSIKMLSRPVFQSWKIASFSSLTANTDYKFSETKETGNDSLENEIVLKDFPAGAGSGEFFHSLLEDLNFDDNDENIFDLVKLKLASFGYKAELWKETINKAINHVLATPLMPATHLESGKNFTLKNIKSKKRLNELEFFFPVNAINDHDLYSVFNDFMKHPASSEYADKLLELEVSSISGFMKGFIDLIFEFEGRWYIVDYKSNFLGNSYNDYSYDAMTEAMMEHHYFLQYHIYVVALHKYLTFRKTDYHYDDHFGGVFYLFLRGMKETPVESVGTHPDGENTAEQGVFFDRPDYEFINTLSNDVF
jgi:exodeoxyribonuclease V beta subunit